MQQGNAQLGVFRKVCGHRSRDIARHQLDVSKALQLQHPLELIDGDAAAGNLLEALHVFGIARRSLRREVTEDVEPDDLARVRAFADLAEGRQANQRRSLEDAGLDDFSRKGLYSAIDVVLAKDLRNPAYRARQVKAVLVFPGSIGIEPEH